ncbi:hypothetical protein QBC40DRAFT_331961 [Triangularia verruculosa]|uniref:Uncharacterized protein n=1 Tax=Triangularia verruculosa TaxID=2587418 RepID=A0AAN6XEK7_9PEZI|nr:hypothetical protein QBC40DRAFT_331961 [Triangularia verruculosa]
MLPSRYFFAIFTAFAPTTFAQPSPNILDWLDLSSSTSFPSETCTMALSGQALSFPNSRAYLNGQNASTGYTSCQARLPFRDMTHGFAFSVFHTFLYGHLSLDKGAVLEEIGVEVVYLDHQGKRTRTDGRALRHVYGQKGTGYNGTFALSMHLKPMDQGSTVLGVTSCPSADYQPVIEGGVWVKLAMEDGDSETVSKDSRRESLVEGLMVEFDVLWSRSLLKISTHRLLSITSALRKLMTTRRKPLLAVLVSVQVHLGLAQNTLYVRYDPPLTTSGASAKPSGVKTMITTYEHTTASVVASTSISTTVAAVNSSEPQPSSEPGLGTGAQAGIITGSALLFFLIVSLSVYFLRLRKRNRESSLGGKPHPGLSTRPSNQHLIGSPRSEVGLQTPKRARTPLSLPFYNSKRSSQGQQGMPLSPSALDIVRERLEMESMGFGYQQDRQDNRREAKSVVESLDWDWKRVYVYPFTSSASSRGSVYSATEGSGGAEGKIAHGLGSYWEVSSGGSKGLNGKQET